MWWLPDPNRRPAAEKRALRLAGALLGFASAVWGQGRGQAELAFQGYYLGGAQPLSSTSGMAFRFQDYLPGLGFLRGSLEGYGSQNGLETGENFLELRGAPLLGQRWTITGGDFRAPAALVEFPFYNIIYTPEISARGIQIQAVRPDSRYAVFAGEETLAVGPRIPYRILAPQSVAGASAVRGIARGLQIGVRFLEFSTSPQAFGQDIAWFPTGARPGVTRTLAAQALYSPMKRLKFYAEASSPLARGPGQLVSSLAGVALETGPFTFRANYARQGSLYFPLAGFYAGDRQGPFVEARYSLWKRLEWFGSASQYRNNLERDPSAASFASADAAAGLTAALPWKTSGSAQISTIRLTSQTPGEQPYASNNRQLTADLSRAFGRHTLRLSWRDLQLADASVPQRQRATEAEDTFQIKRLFVGGAVRLQQAAGTEQRNSVFFRGSAQGGIGRVNLFANVEMGNDLANQTVFSTNTYSTTVAGATVRLFRQWGLQVEAFHNKLNMDLNPESIFVLQSGGMPVSANLEAVTQWSVFFSLKKQIRWGGGLPSEGLERFAATAAPLTGTVEGTVRIKRLSGTSPAAGIPVTLDGRTTATAADGSYRFTGVPEGEHEAALSATDLPAEYDPGALSHARVQVQPRRTARADFEVLPLAFLEGGVVTPDGAPLDGIFIRLLPGSRYTTTGADGSFTFYNVREGDFELALDVTTLPENCELRSPASVPVAVRVGSPPPRAEFSFSVPSKQKPIRKVLEQE